VVILLAVKKKLSRTCLRAAAQRRAAHELSAGTPWRQRARLCPALPACAACTPGWADGYAAFILFFLHRANIVCLFAVWTGQFRAVLSWVGRRHAWRANDGYTARMKRGIHVYRRQGRVAFFAPASSSAWRLTTTGPRGYFNARAGSLTGRATLNCVACGAGELRLLATAWPAYAACCASTYALRGYRITQHLRAARAAAAHNAAAPQHLLFAERFSGAVRDLRL